MTVHLSQYILLPHRVGCNVLIPSSGSLVGREVGCSLREVSMTRQGREKKAYYADLMYHIIFRRLRVLKVADQANAMR